MTHAGETRTHSWSRLGPGGPDRVGVRPGPGDDAETGRGGAKRPRPRPGVTAVPIHGRVLGDERGLGHLGHDTLRRPVDVRPGRLLPGPATRRPDDPKAARRGGQPRPGV